MKKIFFSAILTLILWVLVANVQAQVTPTIRYWKIVTKDSLEYIGQIQDENEEIIRLLTEDFGVIIIKQTDVLYRQVEVRAIQGNQRAKTITHPLATHYILRASALPLRPGEGFYRNTWVFLHDFRVGVTNSFSVGTTLFTLPIFDAFSFSVGWLNLNYTLPIYGQKFRLSLALSTGNVSTTPRLQATWGNRDTHFSIGGGYSFLSNNFGEGTEGGALILLSASHRVSQKGYLVTDNYFTITPDLNVGIFTFAYRISGAIGVDLGLALGTDDAFIGGFPWLSIHLPFGRKIRKFKR